MLDPHLCMCTTSMPGVLLPPPLPLLLLPRAPAPAAEASGMCSRQAWPGPPARVRPEAENATADASTHPPRPEAASTRSSAQSSRNAAASRRAMLTSRPCGACQMPL